MGVRQSVPFLLHINLNASGSVQGVLFNDSLISLKSISLWRLSFCIDRSEEGDRMKSADLKKEEENNFES